MTEIATTILLPEELTAVNINPQTYLATDYLNHFNEVIMLINMLPDMPDMLDDVLEWQPKSYPTHFAQSGFVGRDLAIKAYHCAPRSIRKHFDAVIAEIDTLLLETIRELRHYRDNNSDIQRIAFQALSDLHALVENASGVINGAESCAIDHNDPESHAQTTIDAVFARA